MDSNDYKLSYTSAETFPAKLLLHLDSLRGDFTPMHLQLNLTNKCQLKCKYCSCDSRNKDAEFDIDFLVRCLKKFRDSGTHSVTITGGGEPLLHSVFDRVFQAMIDFRLLIGLVTNGIAIGNWQPWIFRKMQWIRISFDGDRNKIPTLPNLFNVAYSYVWQPGDSDRGTENLFAIVNLARLEKITHLRIVSDILQDVLPIRDQELFAQLRAVHPRVIVQDRCNYTIGAKRCWIGLIKPVLDVDGTVYPCCGAQYAIKGKEKGYPKELKMGTVDEYFEEYIIKQKPFDGSICDKCYYSEYNRFLNAVKGLDQIQHSSFM